MGNAIEVHGKAEVRIGEEKLPRISIGSRLWKKEAPLRVSDT